MAAPLTILHECTTGRGRTPVMSGVDLQLNPGEIYRVSGPNGIGKSTLADTILGFVPPLSGQRNPLLPSPGTRAHQKYFGYMPARVHPLPSLTFRQWATAIAAGFGTEPEHIDALWHRLGGRATDTSRLEHLSSGNLRKAFAFNAFAVQRQLLILDEPFEEIDAEGRTALSELISEQTQAGAAVLVISHSDFHPFDRVLRLSEAGLMEQPCATTRPTGPVQ